MFYIVIISAVPNLAMLTKSIHRRPSLFVDFLAANSLIHISKNCQNGYFLVKNWLFVCLFKIRGPKWRNVSTANNEGNRYIWSERSETCCSSRRRHSCTRACWPCRRRTRWKPTDCTYRHSQLVLSADLKIIFNCVTSLVFLENIVVSLLLPDKNV